jgi:hypothetical protein
VKTAGGLSGDEHDFVPDIIELVLFGGGEDEAVGLHE